LRWATNEIIDVGGEKLACLISCDEGISKRLALSRIPLFFCGDKKSPFSDLQLFEPRENFWPILVI